MEIKCCTCGKVLENQHSMEYLCEECEERYSEDTPAIQSMRKRRKYDDER